VDTEKLSEEVEQKFASIVSELTEKVQAGQSEAKEGIEKVNTELLSKLTAFQEEQNKKWEDVNSYFKRVDLPHRDPESPESRAFENWLRHGLTEENRQYLMPETRELVESDATAGGVLVPDQNSDSIVELVVETEPVYAKATKYTVSGNSLTLPVQDSDASPAYVGEGSAGSESSPGFSEKIVHLHAIKFYTQISDELLEDSAFDVEGFVTRRAAIKVAELAGQDFINGTGDGQPEGIVTNSDINVLTGHDAANDNLDWEDFPQALLNLKSPYRPNANFLLSSVSLYHVLIQDAGSTPMFDLMVNQGPFFNRILTSDSVDDDGSNGNKPLICGDIARGYTIIEKANRFKVFRDPYSNAGYLTLRFVWRVGGLVTDPNAFQIVQV